ncbi:hypothetical protein OWM54_42965 [Myxococcus sp. MISCRS1]|uniref:hypothetical protein n=1 Tax=Myxococcus sp. MISCRS1 TaxID=2996786 RepID=UPI00227193E2|nr:hypothetical protein [Myxococcus sp. MISCRS1]MCY1003927.1 hypothetical protein [Myxococcus sp. MISCRS1]
MADLPKGDVALEGKRVLEQPVVSGRYRTQLDPRSTARMHVILRAAAVMLTGGLLACPDSQQSDQPDGGAAAPGRHVILDAGWGEAAQRLHAVAEVERNGGSITVPNRDGSTTRIVSRLDDGVRIVQYYNNQSSLPVLTTRSVGDDTTHWGDYDEDSRPDYRYDRSVDDAGVLLQVWLEDTDLDGEYDRRRTQRGARGELRVIRERLTAFDGGSPAWRVESDVVLPANRPHPEEKAATWNADSQCDRMAGFPSDLRSTTTVAALPGVRIVDGAGPGACSVEQTRKLVAALEQLPSKAECLAAVNTKLATMLKAAITNGDIPTHIACGGQCPGIRASSDLGPPTVLDQLRFGPYRINIAPYVLDDSVGLARTILHELLHWSAGLEHDEDDNGTDQVWSCSRYCSSCTLGGFGGGDPAADCSRCADGNKRLTCGSKYVVTAMAGCESFSASVHYEVDPVLTTCRLTDTSFARCSTCEVSHWSYCDGRPVPVPVSYPTGYITGYRCCLGCHLGEVRRSCATVPPLPLEATTCSLPAACGTL